MRLTTQSRGPPHGHGIQSIFTPRSCVGPLFWLLEPMYRCCSCDSHIKWVYTLGASTWLPFTCPLCKVEQHRKDSDLPHTLIVTSVALALTILVFVVLEPTSIWLALVYLVLLIGSLIYLELRSYRLGVLVPTKRRNKILTRIFWLALLLPLPVFTIYQVLANGP